jgi:putative DNA methylase
VNSRKKLIEVALPLEAINAASAREKSIRHGHPSTLHLWWARRPLAAARAVIFSQMVDDPSEYTEELLSDEALAKAARAEFQKRIEERKAKEELSGDAATEPEPTLEGVAADIERQRLFTILEKLVKWENTTNEAVLEEARAEVRRSWRRTCADNADHPRAKELFDHDKLPGFHDPFAGGGALPLEAQRLGLEAHASDLNPVAVLINKAMIEIPPRFAGKPPVNPHSLSASALLKGGWKGAQGLAEDVRYYGQWMRDEAEKRIGHFYPKVRITSDMVRERPDLEQYQGQELTVIAWLWARTVKSPNPAFADVDVPLASTFMLSTKKGKEAYVEPVVEDGVYRFAVRAGAPLDPAAAKAGTKLGRGANFRCVLSGAPMDGDYIKAEGKAARMGARLMAIVAEGKRQRVYLTPTEEHEATASQAEPHWRPEGDVPARLTGGTCVPYGLSTWGDLFTPRQLVALTTFSDLVGEAMERIRQDALTAGLPDDPTPLRDSGTGATAYAEAVGVYLAFAVDKGANYWSTLCAWHQTRYGIVSTFGRQALPMVWDFAEANPLSDSSGNLLLGIQQAAKMLEALGHSNAGYASQAEASSQSLSTNRLISTDPPYYDNIGYADLSDFFYVWLRRSLSRNFPELFSTLAVPKSEELVATPYRHGGREQADSFFLAGMTAAMAGLSRHAHEGFPVTIYYAFRQAESKGEEGTASTGWETFLEAVIEAGFGVSGTWPVRTEYTGNLKKTVAALASSIVLVCRPRDEQASTVSRREFLSDLKRDLPAALADLQRSNIAPVDLAQAAIGPGMAVYTGYARVLESDGSRLGVRTALALINQVLDEALAEQEGDFDADTRWALAWFEQCGFEQGDYGIAETLSTAKNTSVSGLVEAGIISAKGGKVRLLAPGDLADEWNPATDPRLTVWEMTHHLIRRLDLGGDSAAAELAKALGAKAEAARELAYRLYTVCERTKRAAEALAYNGLVQSWPQLQEMAQQDGQPESTQGDFFGAS